MTRQNIITDGYPGFFELDGMLVIGTTGFHREISTIVQEISIFQSLDRKNT